MSGQISASLTTTNGTPATGIAGPLLIKDGILSISGTFVGTIQVTVDALGSGTYASAADSSGNVISVTAPCVVRISNGVACNTRVECTAYTSGTIVVGLRA